MTTTKNVEGSHFGEGLPKSFVLSMQTLFDIMDDQHTGYVKYTDIEHRWHEDGTQGLPHGVLASLRKVTPPDGYLTFERFCSGLKMCLLKNRGQEEPVFNDLRGSSLSPTNSLEALGPISSSSPHASPHRHSRPLSAPLLDQETYPIQPISKGNLFNGSIGTRKFNGTSLTNKKFDDTGGIYHAKYSAQASIPLKVHKSYQSNTDSNNTGTIYSMKSDIRMGVGGIKGVLKYSSNSQKNNIGPPKPPRFPEGEIYSQQNMPYRTEMTNSLERESRANKKWDKPKDETHVGNGSRRERGGSLERLLDTGSHQPMKEITYGLPLNKTGMKSAIQSWFKEKSKSDLQRSDKNNNYHVKGSHRQEDLYKETRISKNQPRLNLESTYRGAGDGGDCHRLSGNKVARPILPLTIGIVSAQSNPIGIGVPSPPPVIAHGRNPSLPISSQYTKHSCTNTLDKDLYGKVMETATAVPINYNGNGQITCNGASSQLVPSGVVAHGHYVAPQPPQVAVHKKTAKKKEPRRHTLQNGVDQNVLKRLRQLEAERDMLYQGLDVVDRARAWYKQQMQGISERIRYLPFGTTKMEPSLEREQEKLHFQLARIHEINAHLRALMEASDKGLPTQMNLAIRGTASIIENLADKERATDRLKQQNKLLTEEVSEKSERITALEREKAALLRELFQTRAKQRPLNADSTFM